MHMRVKRRECAEAVALASRWSWRICSFVLACLIAVATSEDPWPIATASAGSGLSIVVFDDDDSDGNAEHVPPCAFGGVDASLWSSIGKATGLEPAHLTKESYRRCLARGPPAPESPCAKTAALDTAVVVASSPAVTSHHTSLEVQTLNAHVCCGRHAVEGGQ